MRLGILAGAGGDWKDSLEKVRIAEDLGYEMVASGEAWGPSVLPWLAAVALNTSHIEIGTSIINTYSRTPGAMAQEYATLEQLSGGRMVLGLGSSGAFVVEHFHGILFERPIQRIREYVEIFDVLIDGAPLNYDGEIFQMSRGFRLDYDRPRNKVPVYIAAITPRSIYQTGEIADGIFPIHWPMELFGSLERDLAAGAEAGGNPDKKVTIAPFTRVTILDGSQEDERRWFEARSAIHHYVNRMGVFYWQMLARNGFESEVEQSRSAWAEREREKSVDAISDEMVRSCQVIGSPGEVRERLKERSALGAEMQMVHMPTGTVTDVGKELESYLS